ncbi:MAG: GAF domain-containing protein [Phycisphaeraceae bacterium]
MNLDDVLATEELTARPSPAPDYRTESEALARLARQLATEPEAILRKLVEAALELTGAPTAGISLTTQDDEGESMYWPVVIGQGAENFTGAIPRNQSPCHVVLDTGRPQLFRHPQRRFEALRSFGLDICETLLVPMRSGGRVFGTLWVIALDETLQFNAEHLRRLEGVSNMAAAGYEMVNALDAARRDRATLERHGHALEAERAQLEAVLEQMPSALLIAETATGRILHRNAAAERLLGTGALPVEAWQQFGADRTFDARGEPLPPDRWPLIRALRQGETVQGESMSYRRPDNQIVHLRVSATPVRLGDGRDIGAVCVLEERTSERREQQRLEQEIAQTRAETEERAAQLRALALELTHAEQRERQRLARLLHDHLQQLLAASRMRVEVARQRRLEPVGEEPLNDILGLLDLAIDASRNLAAELSPPILFEQGLCPALHWLAQRMRRMHDLEVEVDTPRSVAVRDEAVRVFLFDAVRELLFNVVKHAGTRHAWVDVQFDDGHLCIAVDDAGAEPGAPPAGPPVDAGGFGLATIRRRLEIWGGHFETGRSHHGGLHVGLRLPV